VPGLGTDSDSSPVLIFDEMMNWALISLYLIDKAPPADLPFLLSDLVRKMAEKRGFTRFPAFNRFLVDLYRTRPAGATVASLYPQIVVRFEKAAP
jgi:hypothetical protein